VPLTIKAPQTRILIEQVARIASPHLGLIPDAGIFARSIPKFRIEIARSSGVSEKLLKRAVELWNAKTPLKKSLEELKALGLEKKVLGAVEMFWGSFGHSEPKALAEIMPYINHVHGKFFSMKDGDEPDVRYGEFVHALVDGGYDGWMSSEYEGPPADTFAILKAHQAMVQRYISKYSTNGKRKAVSRGK
jgi:hypothetical protein